MSALKGKAEVTHTGSEEGSSFQRWSLPFATSTMRGEKALQLLLPSHSVQASSAGSKSWYFLTADYAFGHALEPDTTAVIKSLAERSVVQRATRPETFDQSSTLLKTWDSRRDGYGRSSREGWRDAAQLAGRCPIRRKTSAAWSTARQRHGQKIGRPVLR